MRRCGEGVTRAVASLLAPEPTLGAGSLELDLVGAQRFARLVEGAGGLGAGEEVDVDARDAVGAEFDVAAACSWVLRGLLLLAQLRDEVLRNRARGALREHAGLRCARVREIADG